MHTRKINIVMGTTLITIMRIIVVSIMITIGSILVTKMVSTVTHTNTICRTRILITIRLAVALDRPLFGTIRIAAGPEAERATRARARAKVGALPAEMVHVARIGIVTAFIRGLTQVGALARPKVRAKGNDRRRAVGPLAEISFATSVRGATTVAFRMIMYRSALRPTRGRRRSAAVADIRPVRPLGAARDSATPTTWTFVG